MKLSISNIAWEKANDERMYDCLKQYGYKGIEIAPTRIFEENPYRCLNEATEWSKELVDKYCLEVSSMQSILYGKTEKLFGTEEERKGLLDYVKLAIDFASAIGCRNLVFGSPRNRIINNEREYEKGVVFFREIGEYALAKNTVIAIEPNPKIYSTNYINTTIEAFDLARHVESDGFRVNVDLGTIISNSEEIGIVGNELELVNHIHISEPFLKLIERREMHKELAQILYEKGYDKYVSIEMSKIQDLEKIQDIMKYVTKIFE